MYTNLIELSLRNKTEFDTKLNLREFIKSVKAQNKKHNNNNVKDSWVQNLIYKTI